MTTDAADAPPPGDGTERVGGLRRVRGFYDMSARTYDQWLGVYERVMGTAERRPPDIKHLADLQGDIATDDLILGLA